MYGTVMQLVLLCGAALWTLKKKEDMMLATTKMKMLRQIKGIRLP